MDLVSVIVPVFNTGRYLEQCLHSVLNQSYPNIELVIIDDGSTDPLTIQILTRFKDLVHSQHQESGKILLLKHETFPNNRGVGAARNEGVNICTGKYFVFLDADDQLVVDAIARLHEASEYYHADITMSHYRNISEEGIDLNSEFTPTPFTSNSLINLKQFVEQDKLLFSFPISPCNKLIDTKQYRDSGTRFREGQIFEDMEWCYRLIMSMHSLVQIDHECYLRVLHHNSITHTLNHSNKLDIVKAQAGILSALQDHKLFDLYYEEFIYSSLNNINVRFRLMTDKNLRLKLVEKAAEFYQSLGYKVPHKFLALNQAKNHMMYKLTHGRRSLNYFVPYRISKMQKRALKK